MGTRSILRPVLRPVTRAVSDTIRGFNPRSLFASGEQGIWLDPSDFSTLFQDSAGTTPVTALGQPVGLALDKSGRGNHAYQPTSASRPTVEARVNLLTQTENVSAADWSFVNASGTATRSGNTLTFGASAVDRVIGGSKQVYAAAYTATVRLSGSGSIRIYILDGTGSTVTSLEVTLTSTPTDYTTTRSIVTAGPSGGIGIYNNFAGTAGASVTFHRADLRLASDSAYPYQRVNTATDYVDVGAPRYLQLDGTDDGMATPSINFTGTDKMTVWAGVRKLSDAAIGMIAELSAASSSNVGAFSVRAPQTTGGGGDYGASSGGSIAGAGLVASGTVLSPNSSVITYTASIGTDTSIIRRNGAPVASSTADQGTGNYGNYPLYIGRRGGTTLPFNGRIYQLIIRGAASNDGQIAAGEAWCNAKTRAY